jgi:hypothetical protein
MELTEQAAGDEDEHVELVTLKYLPGEQITQKATESVHW